MMKKKTNLDGASLRARREGVYEEPLGDQTILFDSASRESITLNPAASFVWSHCDGSAKVGEIVEAFEKANPQAADGATEVLSAINLLAEKGLLLDENRDTLVTTGHSRRSFLNYGALAAKAAAAIPLLGSFLSPSTARADGGNRDHRNSGNGRGHDDHGRGHGYGHDKGRGRGHVAIDCYGGWSGWGECDWFMQAREYTVIIPASDGGEPCPVEDGTIETQDCGALPVDCVGEWFQWAPCSTTCGLGVQSRSYIITTWPQGGGAMCEANNGDMQSQTCTTAACAPHEPCSYANCGAIQGDGWACNEDGVCVNNQPPPPPPPPPPDCSYANCGAIQGDRFTCNGAGQCVSNCDEDFYDPECCFFDGGVWNDEC